MDLIRDWWAAVTAAIALVVWLVRLEGSTKTALREIAQLEKQLDADRLASAMARQETNDMLREVRGDIKRLLAQTRT